MRMVVVDGDDDNNGDDDNDGDGDDDTLRH